MSSIAIRARNVISYNKDKNVKMSSVTIRARNVISDNKDKMSSVAIRIKNVISCNKDNNVISCNKDKTCHQLQYGQMSAVSIRTKMSSIAKRTRNVT